MFFCHDCSTKRKWPQSMSLSSGKCEVCGAHAVCYDVSSEYLPPLPVPVIPGYYKAKHRRD